MTTLMTIKLIGALIIISIALSGILRFIKRSFV